MDNFSKWWIFTCSSAGFFGAIIVGIGIDLHSLSSSAKIIATNYQSPEYDWAQGVMRGKKCETQKGN